MKLQRIVLNDVMIMRPIVIILLIVTHSFTIYSGGTWILPKGIHEVPAYGEITHIAYSFMLETFVFVSGYIFGMQAMRKTVAFKSFFLKKIQRLLVPSIIFSIAYFVCFNNKELSWGEVIISILSGCGHLWYLPMLFWCFLLSYCLNLWKGHDNIKLMLCFCLSICSGLLPLPFRLGNTCYYLLFFYLGSYIYSKREKIISELKLTKVIAMIIGYIVAYIILSFSKEYLTALECSSLVEKLLRVIGMKLCTIIYSGIGLFALYFAVNYFLKCFPHWQCPLWLTYLNSLCFGIYVYQQFVLKFIYYSTPFPLLAGTYALPWVGCVVTIIASITLAGLTVKTKTGKYLIS